MKVSDIVINFLESKVSDIFTISGGGCMHLIDSLGRSNKLNYICNHHEQASAMAAEGYSRIKGLAACIVTTGPGGTNTITGVLGAWQDSIPIMFISGQVSKAQISEGTGCRQIGDQEFDIVTAVSTITKYAVMVKNKRDILYELEKAYQIAISDRPGPVWIDIPLDIQGADVNISELSAPAVINSKIGPTVDEIKDITNELIKSKKPLIIAGNGVRLSNSCDALNKFLETNGIPAVTSVHSGVDVVDNTYKYYAGRIGILGNETSNRIVQEADLIIIIGSRLTVKMTGYDLPSFGAKAKKIFIDIDENEMLKHKNIPNIIGRYKCHIDLFLKLMPERVELTIDKWRQYITDLRSTQKYYRDKHKNIENYASAYYFISRLKRYIGNRTVVTSNGSAHVVTLQSLLLNKGQRMFTNVGCASMGYGLPAAIGVSVAQPGEDVVCIEGDGSLQMNIQELQTIKHHNLPIKLFVINNDGYLSIKITQDSFFGGNEVAAGSCSGVSTPSLEKISSAYGLTYFKIERNIQLDEIISKVMLTTGPVICELFTYPSERHEPRVVHKGVDKDGNIIPGELTNMYISESF